MKKYIISFFSILLLLIVNTSYFWENLPGLFDMAILFSILIGFIILIIVFVNQLIKGINEKFKNRIRILNLLISLTVLILTYLHPFGFIKFEEVFDGENIFFAQLKQKVIKQKYTPMKTNLTFVMILMLCISFVTASEKNSIQNFAAEIND